MYIQKEYRNRARRKYQEADSKAKPMFLGAEVAPKLNPEPEPEPEPEHLGVSVPKPETPRQRTGRKIMRFLDDFSIGLIAIFFYQVGFKDGGSGLGFAFIQLTLIFMYVVLCVHLYWRIQEKKQKIQRRLNGSNP